MKRILVAASVAIVSAFPAHSDFPDATMKVISTINGDITPKSVRASGNGLVSAHNMMYRHSVTVYNAQTRELVETVSDQINLADFGITGFKGLHRGAPVEGSYSPDGKYLYVTNYAMYGYGFKKEGTDICRPSDGYDYSFLYRINLETYKVDAIYKVGVVPKVVEATPDNKYILVTNWCSYDLSVISVEKQKVIKTISIGAYPRGIVVTKDSKTAYIAHMGGADIKQIDLENLTASTFSFGPNPRALVLSPDEKTLYATLNAAGKVVAFDLASKKMVKSVKTGEAARSLTISPDGSYLYAVNFKSATMTKVRTSDFKKIQTLKICNEPIGITYEPTDNKVWVACYKGQIKVVTP